MRNDIQTITFARELFNSDDKNDTYLTGNSTSFVSTINRLEIENRENIREISTYYSCIHSDLWNLSTIAERLTWMQSNALENQDFKDRWFYYASVDIQIFHVEIRSILDYITQIIRLFSPQPGQVTDTGSFRKLLNWLGNNPNRIQEEVADLCLEQYEWFHEMRSIRDFILHSGGEVIAFGSPDDGILFQVMSPGYENLIDKPFLMFNENVAFFDRYAALYFSRAISFLEDLTLLYINQEFPTANIIITENHSPGFSTIVDWMNILLNTLAE